MTITHISERESALELENLKVIQALRIQAATIEALAKTLPGAERQSWELHIVQADAIRELLDLHAPETDGNVQTRLAQVFAQLVQPAATFLKNHEVAALVSRLTSIAATFHDNRSLRQRISNEVTSTLRGESNGIS